MLRVVVSGSMAESGIDLTFDDQTCGSTGQIYDTAASSMMSHLQSSAATSGYNVFLISMFLKGT